MAFDSASHAFALTLQVFLLDLLLSGDNAVVIALACRRLPLQQRRQALLIGTGVAIALRTLLTLLAGALLQVPGLKLLGGIALTVIAVQLTVGGDTPGDVEPPGDGSQRGDDLLSVVATVVVADLVMSADNVLALAAVAQGSALVLVLGLLLSVPLLMFGSWTVTGLLDRYPALVPLGGALLGWVAGDIATSDPLYADWVGKQSPALHVVVPLLMAVYVLLQSRVIVQSAAAAAALRPQPRLRSRPAAPVLPAEVPRTQASVPAPEPKPARAAAEVMAAVATTMAAPPTLPARPPRWRPWMTGVAALGGVGAVVGLFITLWMPAPGGAMRYDCPAKDVALFYRPGGQRIRISNGTNTVDGIVQHDNQIAWGDLHAAGLTLGFVPPTRLAYGTAQVLRVDGGMFEDVTCSAH